MAIYKRCSSCHELFQGKQCPSCSKKRSKKREVDNEAIKVYRTYRWQQCRQNAIIKYGSIDIWLLGAGQVVRCKNPVVHHIVERDDAPELIYRLDNLITCTTDSHAEIHKCYREDKPAALKRIRKGIEEYRRMFGDD